jgi:Domain of unknown function (DUF4173)
MKRTNILWITALLLGWCFDLLFWKQPLGLNFAIYVLLCLAGGWLVTARNEIKPAWKSLLLLIPILLFAFISFARQEPLSLFLAVVLTLGSMGLLAVSFLGGRWPFYSLTDYVVQAFRLAGSLLARPLIFLSETRQAGASTAEGTVPRSRAGWKRFWAMLRGILIALPVLALFAALLASADLVFAQRLQDFTRLFLLENLPQYLFRAFYILVAAYALAGAFLHAARKSQDEQLWSEKPLVPQFLGFTEAAVVLGAVVALFAAFVVIQFQYFFGAGGNIGVQGYTYSEYARSGFGELIAVAFCSLLLFLGLSAIVKRQNPAQRWGFSGLGIGMVLLVGVILVSAFQRLLLYEAAYGFSRLRMYTHIFMIWLGVLLAVVVLLELLRRERFFPLAALLATLGFALSLALVNVDASIVRQNVARASQGQGLDVAYLASLSTDSVPALAAAYEFKVLPGLTRDAVGAVLVCRLHSLSQSMDGGWRSFSLSAWWADQAMTRLQSRLQLYHVTQDQDVVKILTPGNVYYECP